MRVPRRGTRRRAAFLASIWLTFAHGRAPSAHMESRKVAILPPSPLFTVLGNRLREAAGAGAAATARGTWVEANPRSCGNGRGDSTRSNSGNSSSGSAAETASLRATVGMFLLRGGSDCAFTLTPAPPDTAAPARNVRTTAGRLASAELTGGAFLPRNRDRKQQQQGQLQPSSRASSQNTGAPLESNEETASPWPQVRRVLKRCVARAGSGGLPGAAAGLMQVATLMWLRTIVNYQCRYGTSTRAAAAELYRQGGVRRFYRGVMFALLSNPLSRFGMAAANEGAMALTDALPGQVSVTFTTWIASLFAGVWRVMLTPLDTCKTVLQVEGPKGFASLMKKVWSGNLSCLYQGAIAAAAATAVGYFPWFLTFNYLNGRLRKPSVMAWMLLRNAGIGLASSISSDVCSNSIRVLKTTKQAAAAYDAKVTYRGAAALVIEKDGLLGLLGRGLSTRIFANGLQSMLFTVVWRYLHDKYVVPRREAADLKEANTLDGVGGSTAGNSNGGRVSGRSSSTRSR